MAETELTNKPLAEIAAKKNREIKGVGWLADSMGEIGQLQPIGINKKGELLWGYHRYLAAKKLGWETIWAYVLKDGLEHRQATLDENLIHNAGTVLERSEWHAERKEIYLTLHPETKHGGAPGAGKGKGSHCKDEKISSFQQDVAAKMDVTERAVQYMLEPAETLPIKWRQKIHKRTEHRLRDTQSELHKLCTIQRKWPKRMQPVLDKVLGDKDGKLSVGKAHAEWIKENEEDTGSGEAHISHLGWEDWLAQQKPCDLLLTDPPYMTDVEDVDAFSQAWLPAALAKVKPTGFAYVFVGQYPAELRAYLSVPVPKHLILEQVLAWVYMNTLGPSPGHTYKDVWQACLFYRGVDAPKLTCPLVVENVTAHNVGQERGDSHYHPWQKPLELGKRFVRHATAEGDVVLDPFAGTGTFLVAAKELGRIGRGCDSDADQVAICKRRGCNVANS